MTPLEAELIDLGNHLDLGESRPSMVRSMRPQRSRVVLRIAAAVVLLLAALTAFTPSRRALARWLGIGGVEIRPTSTTLPIVSGPTTAAPTTTTASVDATPGPLTTSTTSSGIEIPDEVRRSVPFTIGEAPGRLLRVDVDDRFPLGAVVLTYDGFTLYEYASPNSTVGILAKLAPPGTTVDFVTVNGEMATWISGDPHQLVLVDADGEERRETVRNVGSTLLWHHDGVTFRLEGTANRTAAQAIAELVS